MIFLKRETIVKKLYLIKVTIPKGVKTIEKEAFYGCSNLSKIGIKSDEIVKLKANCFKGISKKAVIDVPNRLVKKYKKKISTKTGFIKRTMRVK